MERTRPISICSSVFELLPLPLPLLLQVLRVQRHRLARQLDVAEHALQFGREAGAALQPQPLQHAPLKLLRRRAVEQQTLCEVFLEERLEHVLGVQHAKQVQNAIENSPHRLVVRRANAHAHAYARARAHTAVRDRRAVRGRAYAPAPDAQLRIGKLGQHLGRTGGVRVQKALERVFNGVGKALVHD